ncbi:unnamed protein product [Coffea canephora]|uniref:C2H2-type domain-containing protein n=1 Tax=Coffea canephora TaxID=49390 RepID=A0A068TX44_COFCA|nr:unnamed protein product [Coffea canephora]
MSMGKVMFVVSFVIRIIAVFNAQLHLDLGQSDFLLHTCSTCGVKYACGDEADEKLHKELHKDYPHGIKFKGWKNERVVSMPSGEAGPILVVLEGDPLAHKKMVEKVLQMMEVELGSGSLIHMLCKVYLFIVHQRIAACPVLEPISKAYRAVSKSGTSRNQENAGSENNKQDSYLLKMGGNNLQRQVVKKPPKQLSLIGLYGFYQFLTNLFFGILVIPHNLDTKAISVLCQTSYRITFIKDFLLEPSQLAFSEPTSTGSALASRYFGTPSFLPYRADI